MERLGGAAGPRAFAPFRKGECAERASGARGYSVLRRSTVELLECLRSVDGERSYAPPPRRILTSDARPTTHGGWDNALNHAIVAVGDLVRTGPGDDACVYQVTAALGSGTFAAVFSCQRVDGHEQDGQRYTGGALKILRNSPAYAMQALQELRILRLLNNEHDPDDAHHIVRLHMAFTYRHHICFVFEALGCSLLDLIAGNGYRGMPLQQVRPLLADLLDALEVLAEACVVHADVKPENVLLMPASGTTNTAGLHLKLIDFGSAVITTEQGEGAKPSHYHQSRFYRAPEVLVGAAQHSMKPGIDVWSCGCIAAELYLGLPIFPGTNEYEQLFRIQEVVGNPPDDILRFSTRTDVFFDSIVVPSTQRRTFQLKTPEAFGSREGDIERYFDERDLFSLIDSHSEVVPSDMRKANAAQHALSSSDFDDNCVSENICGTEHDTEGELSHASTEVKQLEALWVKAFAHFLCGLLDADPRRRWTAAQVSSHPFITGEDLATVMIWHPDDGRLPDDDGVGSAKAASGSAAVAIEGSGAARTDGVVRLAKSISPRRDSSLEDELSCAQKHAEPKRRHGSDITTAPMNVAGTAVSRGTAEVVSSSAPSQSHVLTTTSSTASPWFGGGGLKVASGLPAQQIATPIMGGATSTMAAAVAAANMTNSAADAMRRAAAIDKAESRRWKQQPEPRLAAGAAHVVLKNLQGGPLAARPIDTRSNSKVNDPTRGYEPGFRELLRRIDSRNARRSAC